MISAVNWVPRGAANPNPPRYQVVLEEVEQLKERARVIEERAKTGGVEDDDDDDEEEEDGGNQELDENGLPKFLNMDQYEDEDDNVQLLNADEDDSGEDEMGRGALEATMDELEQEQGEEEEEEEDGEGEGEEEEEEEGDEDGMDEEEGGGLDVVGATPASELMVGDEEEDDDDDESDIEDLQIRTSDAVLLVATTEDQEHSTLEVHVYEEETGNMYVHHDITLPAFPLSLAWGNFPPRGVVSGDKGNVGSFAAVGTFQPGIEIWDLDIVDPLEPVGILGGEQMPELSGGEGGGKDKKKKKKKKNKGPTLQPGSHTDAVMTLSWNREHRQILASGSADQTVKLWDLNSMACSHTCSFHTDKVVSVQWHPVEGTVLATASFDRTSHILDGRSPDSSCRIALSADAECLAWNTHNPSQLYLSTEDGRLTAYDVRAASSPLFNIKAHNKALSSFSFSHGAPGLLATCSVDKTVKLWDTASTAGAEPVLLGEKSMAVGKLFSISFYPSSPFLLATGGDKGMVALWNLDELESLTQRFRERMGTAGGVCVSHEAIASSFGGMSIDEEDRGGKAGDSGEQETKSKKKKKKKKESRKE